MRTTEVNDGGYRVITQPRPTEDIQKMAHNPYIAVGQGMTGSHSYVT